jgi:hypothetical protein
MATAILGSSLTERTSALNHAFELDACRVASPVPRFTGVAQGVSLG